MKKIAITILTAPLVGIMTASAGEEVVPVTAPSSCACVPYFGISYVDGEQSLNLFGTPQSYDVSGLRFVGGVDLGNGYSVDARYEKLSGDFPIFETQTLDLDSDELRILLNRDFELSETLNLFGGIGYGWRDISVQGSSIGGDGVLANLGLEYSTGHYFASLVYTHCFTQNSDLSNAGIKKEDFGYLEATVGYDITEQLAATLAYECNVYGDQYLEKDHVIAIGLNYSF
ncbi:MAG: hypothetical protein ACO3SO_03455 [Luteolibacter sp.]